MTTQVEEQPLIDNSHHSGAPLMFSIATGLGFICYALVKVAGKLREVSWLIWTLTVLFILRYVYLAAA